MLRLLIYQQAHKNAWLAVDVVERIHILDEIARRLK